MFAYTEFIYRYMSCLRPPSLITGSSGPTDDHSQATYGPSPGITSLPPLPAITDNQLTNKHHKYNKHHNYNKQHNNNKNIPLLAEPPNQSEYEWPETCMLSISEFSQ